MSTWTRYTSAFTGHPTLSGTAGDLTTLLDAVLVDGTTAQSVTSITRSGSTATLTCAAHGVPVGDIVERTVAGANETDYNGTYLMTAASTTTFTYTVSNSPATPATGTITYNTAGRGWTKAFTATNKRAYYMGSGCVARKYLRVNDAAAGTGGAKEALVRGFNTMSDIDTGTGPFPTAAQSALTQSSLVWRKSNTADGTARTWDAWADDRTLVIVIYAGDNANVCLLYYFGEYESSASSDTTAAILQGKAQENTTSTTANEPGISMETGTSVSIGTGTGGLQRYVCGDANGLNVSSKAWAAPAPFSVASAGTVSQLGYISYPNAVDGGLYLSPLLMYRPNAAGTAPNPIGKLRGLMVPLHPASSFSNGDIFNGVGDFAGRIFVVKTLVAANNVLTGQAFIENGTNPPYSS